MTTLDLPLPLGPTTATNRPAFPGRPIRCKEPLHEAVASVEILGVGLFEGTKSLVGIDHLGWGSGCWWQGRCAAQRSEEFVPERADILESVPIRIDGIADDLGDLGLEAYPKFGDVTQPAGQALGDQLCETGDVGLNRFLEAGGRSGQPEAREIRVAVLIEQHVRCVELTMRHPGAVGCFECSSEVLYELSCSIRVCGSIGDSVSESAPRHQPRDQIRGTRLPPVVVQGHDVGLLESRDDAGPLFEPADERRVVGNCRWQHSDGDLAAQGRLERPIGCSELVLGELGAHLVAADRQTTSIVTGKTNRPSEVGFHVSEHHALLEKTQLGGWLYPELLGETTRNRAVGAQRLGLSSGPVKGQHQLA